MVKKAIKKSIARASHKAVKKVVKEAKKSKIKKEIWGEKLEDVLAEVQEEVKVEEAVVVIPVEYKPVVLPVYDGFQVTAILAEDKSKKYFRCSAVDRNGNAVTIHVPRERF